VKRLLASALAGALSLVVLSPADPAQAVPDNLVADGGFDSIGHGMTTAWTCGPGAVRVRIVPPPGADFVHFVPVTDPEAPPTVPKPGGDTVPKPGGAAVPTSGATAARAALVEPAAASAVQLLPTRAPAFHGAGFLQGTPAPQTLAECSQRVPVRPGETYTLSARVRGGGAALGTEYGSITAPASVGYVTLSTTFTTGAQTRFVKVFIRGVAGAPRYEADNVSLTGALSTTDIAAPGGLKVDRQTSSTMRLFWAPSPGAVGYDVVVDGVVASVPGTAALVRNLVPGRGYTLAVRARNEAGVTSAAASMSAAPVPVFPTPPGPPHIHAYQVMTKGGVPGVGLMLSPGQFTTDGYAAVVNDVVVGWSLESLVFVAVPPGTPTTIRVLGLNSRGASVPSQPRVITLA
jgi:hypothetical protein